MLSNRECRPELCECIKPISALITLITTSAPPKARKVKKLFQNIDVSGDGSINLEEPATRCVLSPFKVRAELCKDTFAREATELQGVKWFRV